MPTCVYLCAYLYEAGLYTPVSVLVRVGRVERLEFVEQRVDDVDEEHEVHLHSAPVVVLRT